MTSSREPIVGVVLPEPDHHRFAETVVEALTEHDYRDLPEDLRKSLDDWSYAFCRWARMQTDPTVQQTGRVYDVYAQTWRHAWE